MNTVKIKQRKRFRKYDGFENVETSIIIPSVIVNQIGWKKNDLVTMEVNKKEDSLLLKRVKNPSFFIDEEEE